MRKTNGTTPAPEGATPSCGVWWCATDHGPEPDHYAESGGVVWPEVFATGDLELSGLTVLSARPVWFASDKLDPLVCLHLVNEKHSVELDVDLRIDEVQRLATVLQRGLSAARSPHVRPSELDVDPTPAHLAKPVETILDVIESLHALEGRLDDALRVIERPAS